MSTLAPLALSGLTRSEVDELVASWGERPFRAKQLWAWLHVRLVDEVAGMSDLPLSFRQRLEENALPPGLQPTAHQQAADGTEKWLLRLADGEEIETVYIPDEERGTLCISSQAGCTLACPFCWTGLQGFSRNLTTAEIVDQVRLARRELAPRERRVTNVVFMGMGEPFYNYDAVSRAVTLLMDYHGLAIGSRKITLSTAGVAPLMARALRELGVNLAVSLHAARDELRDRLVPLNRKFNLAAIRQACLEAPLKQGRRIFWEYLLLGGVNDSLEDAHALTAFVRGIPSKVNLIPFNPWPGSEFQASTPEATAAFQEVLWKAGLVTVIRQSRGAEIAAACGQLKGSLHRARSRDR